MDRREAAFGSIADKVVTRIDRVGSLAGAVSSAGGDVSAVMAKLAEARADVTAARTAEAEAVQMFRTVPQSTSRRAAFAAAKARAKSAVRLLADARVDLRNAILDLRAVVNGLRGVSP